MASIANQHYNFHPKVRRGIQKVCVGMGVGLLAVGCMGIMMPGFLGMHLNFVHNMIHLGSGALALWAGFAPGTSKAYGFSVAFGTFYGFLGVLGFLLGGPGYPAMGHLAPDENLLRIIPNVLEFGTNDHLVHIFISAVLLISAMAHKRRFHSANRVLIEEQGRSEVYKRGTFFKGTTTRPTERNSCTDLSDADLGRSDVNRPSDIKRRDDFERRV